MHCWFVTISLTCRAWMMAILCVKRSVSADRWGECMRTRITTDADVYYCKKKKRDKIKKWTRDKILHLLLTVRNSIQKRMLCCRLNNSQWKFCRKWDESLLRKVDRKTPECREQFLFWSKFSSYFSIYHIFLYLF